MLGQIVTLTVFEDWGGGMSSYNLRPEIDYPDWRSAASSVPWCKFCEGI